MKLFRCRSLTQRTRSARRFRKTVQVCCVQLRASCGDDVRLDQIEISSRPSRPSSEASCGLQITSGFTLIEVVIGSALMSLILVSGYLLFSASIESRRTMEPRLEIIQSARVVMAMISADLRAACSLDKKFAFLGMHRTIGEQIADNLDFATHNYTPQKAGEGDYCQISYYLDQDAEGDGLTLWRRRNPTIAPDSLSGGSKELIASGLSGMRFEYFDGLEWFDDWGDTSESGKRQTSEKAAANLTGMPRAVRVTLWFQEKQEKSNDVSLDAENERQSSFKFQTVVRLNLAEAVNASSSSQSGETVSSGSQDSPAGGVITQ